MKKTFSNLKKGAFLAPMADFTNVAFRSLCKEYGSALQYTELISCKSIIHKNSKTKKMLFVSEKEKPVFLQLFGNNPKDFSKAIKIVEKENDFFAGYDLNAGCSVPKAIKGKYGCFLMSYPKLIGEIIKEMKNSTTKPITIKMRLGFEKENFLEVAKEVEKNGVDAICLHARLGKQFYSGKADWEKIRDLKKQCNVPIIGNGDVKNLEEYVRMKKETNCDYVMIGRSAIGNAFLFKQIKEYEENKKIIVRNKKEIFLEGKQYIELAKKHSLKINDIRGYFINISKNFLGAKELRNKFALTKSINELEKIFFEYFQKE
jgi:tRNA-dihydrouridine synthase B